MFVYTETVYRAVATGTFEVTRRCGACGHQSTARVNSLSEGQAESAYGLSNKQDLANDRATRGLEVIARSTLDLAACPHCSARESDVLGRARRGALSAALFGHAGGLALFGLALVTLAIGVLVSLEPRVDLLDKIITFLVGLAFGTGWFLFVRSLFRKKLRSMLETADAKVVWLVDGAPPPEVEALPPPAATPPASNGWPFA